MESAFLSAVKMLRERARSHIEQAAASNRESGDRSTVIRLLNEALATEIACVVRYKRHHFMARGVYAPSVATEFLRHAEEEQRHAEQIADRIVQLEAKPNFSPEESMARGQPDDPEGETLFEMIKEDLAAERVAIENYREMIQYVGESDSTTRRLLETMLEKEMEHAHEISPLLRAVEPVRSV